MKLQRYNEPDFPDYLSNLIASGRIDDKEIGIIKYYLDHGYEALSDKQRYVFNRTIEENSIDDCARCAIDIPWCEMLEALDNGGYCNYCQHMMEKEDEDDERDLYQDSDGHIKRKTPPDTKITISCPSNHRFSVDLSTFDIDWEIVEADEREMGTEFLHEAEINVECSTCDESLTIYLRVWEYPEGCFNMQEIELSEGVLIKQCSLIPLWQK